MNISFVFLFDKNMRKGHRISRISLWQNLPAIILKQELSIVHRGRLPVMNITSISHLFSPFAHLFWVWLSKKKVWNIFFSPNSLTYWLLPTNEISDSYRQSIRGYWQFHTFFPIFTSFLGVASSNKGVKYMFFSK